MSRTRDMTVGDPTRHILIFSLPIVAGNLLQQLYSLVDTFVVGRVEGVTALAAVSSSGWLDWMVLSIAIGLAQGFAIQIAQSFGAHDQRQLSRAAGQGVTLAVTFTLLLEVLAQSLLVPVLRLLNTPAETFELTALYLRIIFSGLPLVMGHNMTAAFLRSVGNSRTPLVAMVVSTVTNIGLDLLFVAALRMGVAGAAWATVTAQGLSFLVCLIGMLRQEALRFRASDLPPDLPMIRRLLSLGMPMAMQDCIISIGGLVLQGVVNGFGFIFMAGYSATSRLQGLLEVAGSSLGAGCSTFAGQNRGAGRLDRVRLGLRRSAQIGVGMALVIAALLFAFGPQLLSLFIEDEDPAVVSQVLTYATRMLRVNCSALFALYLLFVYRSTIQGLGDTVIPMASGFVELAMRVGSALLLPALVGEWGVYTAEILAWIGAAVFLIRGYYYRINRLSKEA